MMTKKEVKEFFSQGKQWVEIGFAPNDYICYMACVAEYNDKYGDVEISSFSLDKIVTCTLYVQPSKITYLHNIEPDELEW